MIIGAGRQPTPSRDHFRIRQRQPVAALTADPAAAQTAFPHEPRIARRRRNFEAAERRSRAAAQQEDPRLQRRRGRRRLAAPAGQQQDRQHGHARRPALVHRARARRASTAWRCPACATTGAGPSPAACLLHAGDARFGIDAGRRRAAPWRDLRPGQAPRRQAGSRGMRATCATRRCARAAAPLHHRHRAGQPAS